MLLRQRGFPSPTASAFIGLIIFIIYIILSYIFTLLCVCSLFLNPRIRTPGEQGLCSGHSRHLINIITYKDGVESVLINKDSVESPDEVRK